MESKDDELEYDIRSNGLISTFIGIIGAVLIINWFYLYPNFPPVVFGLIAYFLGKDAKKDGDKYGKYGVTLGIIATGLGLMQVIAWFIYVIISMNI